MMRAHKKAYKGYLQDMEYKENILNDTDYCGLRESVGWRLFGEEQMRAALAGSLCTIAAVWHGRTIGMGRVIGDGMYYMIADVVVHPDYQKRGIGTEIINRLIKYVERQVPDGGRASIQLISEKGKEGFYQNLGFKLLPHEYCGAGMRKVIWKGTALGESLA